MKFSGSQILVKNAQKKCFFHTNQFSMLFILGAPIELEGPGMVSSLFVKSPHSARAGLINEHITIQVSIWYLLTSVWINIILQNYIDKDQHFSVFFPFTFEILKNLQNIIIIISLLIYSLL